jgi:hypothetical protein
LVFRSQLEINHQEGTGAVIDFQRSGVVGLKACRLISCCLEGVLMGITGGLVDVDNENAVGRLWPLVSRQTLYGERDIIGIPSCSPLLRTVTAAAPPTKIRIAAQAKKVERPITRRQIVG